MCVSVCVCVCVCVCVHAQSLSHVRLFAILCTIVHHTLLSTEFLRQEYWSRLPVPTPGDLLNLGMQPASLESPAFAGGFFTTEISGKPL